MRVTGGVYRGRTIRCPPGAIRPAMDRMRESVFAILGDLSDCSFLDLYSGSGVVGIEAASRGADPVVLVEKDFRKKRTLFENIRFVTTRIEVSITPVERFLRADTRGFELVFLDPPFDMAGKGAIVDAVAAGPHLNPEGLLVIHLPKEEAFGTERKGLTLIDERRYGRSRVLFFRRNEGGDRDR